ncbi:unnamed protein product, partial [Didymodactylos carnosus]
VVKLLHPVILGPRQECEVQAQVPISTAETVILHPKQQLQHNPVNSQSVEYREQC